MIMVEYKMKQHMHQHSVGAVLIDLIFPDDKGRIIIHRRSVKTDDACSGTSLPFHLSQSASYKPAVHKRAAFGIPDDLSGYSLYIRLSSRRSIVAHII
jgi:hypothetical protein